MAGTEQTSTQRRLRGRAKTSLPPVCPRLTKPKRGGGSGRPAEEKEEVEVEQLRSSAEDERILALVRSVKLELSKGKHRVISCVKRPKHPQVKGADKNEASCSRLKSPQQTRKKRRKSTPNLAKLKLSKKYRDWTALPTEALRIVFQKLGVVGVLASAQSVCSTWRTVAKTVTLRPFIDLRIIPESTLSQIDPEKLAISAFHRTTGPIEDLHVVSVGDDFLALVAPRFQRGRR